jgi:Cu+-exporting ATPase
MKLIAGVLGGVALAALAYIGTSSVVARCCAGADAGGGSGSSARAAGGEAAEEVAPPRFCRLRVDGMTCGGCAKNVEAALAGVEGVRKASVDFDKRLATVELAGDVTAERLCEAVKKAGYAATPLPADPSATEKVCLRVSGMTCEGCRSAVDTALEGVEGVKSAEVDLAKGVACVTREAGKASTAALVEAVARAGGRRDAFRAEPLASEPTDGEGR